MRTQIIALSLVASSLFAPRIAQAQEDRHIGLAIGLGSVGVLWPVADWLALRPGFSISRTSGEDTRTGFFIGSEGGALSSDDAWMTSVELSALFYVGRWDALRTYVSPTFGYRRLTFSTSSIGSVSESRNSSYSTSGSFGAQYSLARHFGIFGETGLTYTKTESKHRSRPATVPEGDFRIQSTGSTSGVNTESAVGVIFFF